MITLIGEAHFDINKMERIAKLLNGYRPDVIGFESTAQDFETGLRIYRVIVSKGALDDNTIPNPDVDKEALRRFLYLTGDVAVDDYVRENNAKLVFCDDPVELNKIDFVKEYQENMTVRKDTERILLGKLEDALKEIEDEYNMAEYPVADMPDLVQFYQTRDAFAERVLREQKGNIVHIGGLDHIFGNYHPNLFDRLSDLHPTRIRLNEADRF